MEFAELLSALGRSPDDLIAISRGEVYDWERATVADAQEYVSNVGDSPGTYYFGVNTLDHEKVKCLKSTQRGGKQHIEKVDVLFADLDSKPVEKNGLGSAEKCREFLKVLTDWLGQEPTAVVATGTGGLHPYWKLDRPVNPHTLTRWKEQVQNLASEFGGCADGVFDPARVLRVPGLMRAEGQRVELVSTSDSVLDTGKLLERLPFVKASTHESGEYVPAETWPKALETSKYVQAMIAGWETDMPTKSRHEWFLNCAHRLMAAKRFGRITSADFSATQKMLTTRYMSMFSTNGTDRSLRPNEVEKMFEYAEANVEGRTETDLKTNELGERPEEVNQEIEESWQLEDLTGYIDGSIKPPVPKYWARSDGLCMLYPGKTHSIIAESESGKSMLMLFETAGILANGGGVLYLDYEDSPNSIVDRLKLMGVTVEQFKRFAYLRPEIWHETSDRTRELFESLLAKQWDLAVLDGVTEALSQMPANLAREVGGTGGNNPVTVWNNKFPKVIAEKTGAAVVMIDHKAKGSKDRNATGGAAKMWTITGASYVLEVVEPMGRGMIGELKLKLGKDKGGYIRSHAVNYDSGTRLADISNVLVDGTGDQLSVTLEPPADKLDIRADIAEATADLFKSKITHWLDKQTEPKSGRAIRDALGGSPNRYTKVLQELTADDYIRVEKKGSANMYTIVSTYGADPQTGYAVGASDG